MKVLVLVDRQSGYLMAHVVDQKGLKDETVATRILEDLIRTGRRGKLILRSDQEPSLVQVLEEVARRRSRDSETILEHSPTGDSKSNGRIERSVMKVEEMARTLRIYLETQVREELPVAGSWVHWLVGHAAFLLNTRHVDVGGTTAHERIRGNRYRGDMFPFGCIVLMRFTGKMEGGDLRPRWCEAVWLGKHLATGEHVGALCNGGRVVRARAVRETPTRPVAQDIRGIRDGAPETLHRELAGDCEEVRGERQVVGDEVRYRDFKITRQILERVGFTEECPKCRDVRANSNVHPFRAHTQQCRRRVYQCRDRDEVIREAVERASDRRPDHIESRTPTPRGRKGGGLVQVD